jgi:chaperonin GroEL
MNLHNQPKHILLGEEARACLLQGVEQLAEAVACTMGPGGLNVVIETDGHIPVLTKDGVTVAKAVNLPDRMQNLGVNLVKQAAQGAAEVAGDGTTTSTVLAYNLFKRGLRLITSGHNSVEFRKGMRDAKDQVISVLNEMKRDIESSEDIINVGTVSANGEREIGELLATAMQKVGRDGIITVEEAKGFKTSLQTVEGTRIDRGFISPYFVNDAARNVVRYEKPFVLLANRKFSNTQEILPLLEKVHQSGKPLLIVADDVVDGALQVLVQNNVKNIIKVCVIRAPEFGNGRVAAMDDLALMLNTKVVTNADTIASLGLSDLGTCDKLVVSASETTIVGVPVDNDTLNAHTASLSDASLEPGLTTEEKNLLARRLNRLSGGVAILKVGGSTEAELRERKDRVEDALYATRGAVQSGILPGGGTSLLKAAKIAKQNFRDLQTDRSPSYEAGFGMFLDVCYEPIKQIAKNCGQVPDLIVAKVTESDSDTYGFNARTFEYGDMLQMGVIDPTLVVVSACQNATSAADNLLSISCAMVNVPSNSDESFETLER